MADVVISRTTVPVLPKNQGLWVETAPVADGDDLVLAEVEQPSWRFIRTTPAAATTSFNSISNGAYAGQQVQLAVDNANTLRVPAALGNVTAAANLDATQDAPLTLLWTGTTWVAA